MYTRIGLVPHLPLFAIRLFHSASTMYTYNSPLPGVLSYSLEKEKRSSLIPKNFWSGIESLEENADLLVSINLPTFPTFPDLVHLIWPNSKFYARELLTRRYLITKI